MSDSGSTSNSLLGCFGGCCAGQNGYYQLGGDFDICILFPLYPSWEQIHKCQKLPPSQKASTHQFLDFKISCELDVIWVFIVILHSGFDKPWCKGCRQSIFIAEILGEGKAAASVSKIFSFLDHTPIFCVSKGKVHALNTGLCRERCWVAVKLSSEWGLSPRRRGCSGHSWSLAAAVPDPPHQSGAPQGPGVTACPG